MPACGPYLSLNSSVSTGRSVQFYMGLLGFRVLYARPEERFAFLDFGGTMEQVPHKLGERMMVQYHGGREKFELRRQSDDLVYTFVRREDGDGNVAYQRQDQDLWIVYRLEWGWVAWDQENNTCLGRPWGTMPDHQGDYPPEGDWVSRKGSKSYVYTLVYV